MLTTAPRGTVLDDMLEPWARTHTSGLEELLSPEVQTPTAWSPRSC